MPHFDDGLTPVEEVMRGMEHLVAAGKVIHVGLTNFPAWRMASGAAVADARGWAPLSVVQLEYNLLERSADREHLPFARARGLGVMGYSPMAGGRVGKDGPAEAGARPIQETVRAIAGETASDPAAVALAWLAAKDIVPILGARTRAQLAGTLAGIDLVLDPGQIQCLDAVSAGLVGQPYELLAQQRRRMGLIGEHSGAVL